MHRDRLGIDRVALAQSAAYGPVGAGNLDDLVAACGEESCQSGAAGAGTFDTESNNVSHADSPAFKARVAGGVDSKPALTQAGPEPVDGDGNVCALVSIDPHHYPGAVELCDLGLSCLLVLRVGWHPPVPARPGTGLRPGL